MLSAASPPVIPLLQSTKEPPAKWLKTEARGRRAHALSHDD